MLNKIFFPYKEEKINHLYSISGKELRKLRLELNIPQKCFASALKTLLVNQHWSQQKLNKLEKTDETWVTKKTYKAIIQCLSREY